MLRARQIAVLVLGAVGLFLRQAFGIAEAKRDERPNVIPNTPEDRDYLKMLHENHAEFARQHQVLRAAATGFFLALIAGLLAATVGGQGSSTGGRDQIGVIICGLSILGFILNAKHYERNVLHEELEMKFRQSLEGGLGTEALTKINSETRDTHKDAYVLAGVEIQTLYSFVYVATLIIGAVVLYFGVH